MRRLNMMFFFLFQERCCTVSSQSDRFRVLSIKQLMSLNSSALLYYKDNSFFMPFIVIRSGNTTVEFYLVMDRDVTPGDIGNVSSALVNLRRSKISVRLSKYNILREPTVGTSQGEYQSTTKNDRERRTTYIYK